jgi:hypothetical protein
MTIRKSNANGTVGIPSLIHTHHICDLDYRTRRFSSQCAVFLEVALAEEATCYVFERRELHLFWAGR